MSISGLSGILAGVYALIGFFFAYRQLAFQVLPGISADSLPEGTDSGLAGLLNAFTGGYLGGHFNIATIEIATIGMITLLFAVGTGILLTMRKAKKENEKIWNNASKRLLLNFMLPVVAGAVFCAVLLQYGIIGLIGPATLIFYGLGLINASKYTIGDIRFLGILILILGFISTQFIGFGLFFWALGFGVFHIIYGARLYFKYDRH